MATLDAAQRTARPCLLLSQHLLGPTYRLPGVEANTGDPLRIFLDAEFNGFGGDLISIALVCEDGQEWYEVAEIPAEPHPFVVQHVLPVLGKEPIGRGLLRSRIPDPSRANARADRALGAGLRTPGETRTRHTLLRAMIGR